MRKHLIIILILLATTSFARERSITPTPSTWSILSSLSPGDTVFLEDGVYNNFQVDIRGNGTAARPIYVKARNPGNVFIEGVIAVRKAGNFITVSGFHFRNGWGLTTQPTNPNREAGLVYQFRIGTGEVASNSRLTNSVFDSLFNPSLDEHNRDHDDWWIGLYHGSNNRIDNNYFGFKRGYGVLMFVDPRLGDPNVPSNHILENNFFGYRPLKMENGVEQLRIGDSDRSMFSVGMIVRNNVFYHNNGEIEIISIKSADNIIENNLVYESRGQFTFRHGVRNTVRNNVFIGNGLPNRSGVRVINADQRTYNNWFQGLRGHAQWSALVFQMGLDPTCPLNSFYQVDNALVAYNTFVDSERITIGHSTNAQLGVPYVVHRCRENQGRLFRPINSRFKNNLIFSNFLADTLVNAVPIYVVARNAVADMDSETRDAGIVFESNLFKINNPTWMREGFSQLPTLNFVRPEGSLFYQITAGAKNIENFGKPPKIPNLYEVGATWFACIRTKYFSRYTSFD